MPFPLASDRLRYVELGARSSDSDSDSEKDPLSADIG